MPIPKTSSGIPKLAFGCGTYYYKYGNNTVDEKLVAMIKATLAKGVVHIDSAEVYNVDKELGLALAESHLPREDYFITDKYFAGTSSYDARSKEANPYLHLKAFLERVNIPYVDLYLLHSPFIKKETHGFSLSESWKFMEQCKREGLAKRIGVSNFAIEHLEEILKVANEKPEVNQIEYNAYLQNQSPGIVEFSQKNGILLEAYSPLGPITKGDKTSGVGKEFDDYLTSLESKYGKTKTQILLNWVEKKGIIPITTTSKESRLDEFLDVFSFDLTPEEVETITKIGAQYKPPLRQHWVPEYGKYDNFRQTQNPTTTDQEKRRLQSRSTSSDPCTTSALAVDRQDVLIAELAAGAACSSSDTVVSIVSMAISRCSTQDLDKHPRNEMSVSSFKSPITELSSDLESWNRAPPLVYSRAPLAAKRANLAFWREVLIGNGRW
ncbi:hypothetical protein OGAPHI_005674 [Ogataea philodendri]|uniref:2-dehydropantolactone reductase n=1 Tax=Ogataea philodendri TaxID=1378263 RepID=A0A9P8NZL1_9ASCO|nr:uncharacterized protein OGAPHI_005674 [Ogataea philodendri]KAH3662422.1 hypothetical protein OGAPHI_005674 [Ogataea philodendri]